MRVAGDLQGRLTSEARHRGVPSCVLTFEPHPRDHFARLAGLQPAAVLCELMSRPCKTSATRMNACDSG